MLSAVTQPELTAAPTTSASGHAVTAPDAAHRPPRVTALRDRGVC